MNQTIDYDVVIVGGGMVGATMVCALHGLGLRIAVVEAFPFRSDNQPSYDARSIALAYGSRKIFEALDLWQQMRDHATAIRQIHVSDRGQFGVTRLNAAEENVPALGYVVENRIVGATLNNALDSYEDIEMLCPATLEDLNISDAGATLSITQNNAQRVIRAKLVIAADGNHSPVRKILNIESSKREYGQTAIISNVTPSLRHNNIAYERFTDSGPLALLPMSENRCSLVFTVRDTDVESVMSMCDASFLELLNNRFGYRLGRFVKTSKRHAYPLSLVRTSEHVRDRVAIIGNAAHTLHPIAGQGFNLGIRDVAVLSEVIAKACKSSIDPGSLDVLNEYYAQRKRDHQEVIAVTDTLARIFSNSFIPLAHARSKGLVLTDLFPSLKHNIARRAMGMGGRLPRLARGLPL